jgi:hypothetical protein
MDTPVVARRRPELDPALAAGFGWTFALVFTGVLFGTADASDLGLRPILGAAAIGLAGGALFAVLVSAGSEVLLPSA